MNTEDPDKAKEIVNKLPQINQLVSLTKLENLCKYAHIFFESYSTGPNVFNTLFATIFQPGGC